MLEVQITDGGITNIQMKTGSKLGSLFFVPICISVSLICNLYLKHSCVTLSVHENFSKNPLYS